MTTELYRAGTSPGTVKDPEEGFEVTRQHVGHAERTLDGTLRRHWMAFKSEWQVIWLHLTNVERDTLVAQLAYTVPMKWKPPDGATTYDVLVNGAFIVQATQFGWTVSATLTEI